MVEWSRTSSSVVVGEVGRSTIGGAVASRKFLEIREVF